MAKLPGFDLERFDKLEDYALALGHTQAIFRAASGPDSDLTELAAETVAVRDTVYKDAIALAGRRLLEEGRVLKLRSNSGYKNIAFDVIGLVELMREHWATIEGRTAVRREDLEHAAELADRLFTAVGCASRVR